MSLHPLTLGALVADAAAMGLHWIYDQRHIALVAPHEPVFFHPSPANYDNTQGYYAHPHRTSGDQSQYGEQVLVMHRALENGGLKNGTYYPAAYARAFHAHFGYGGAYVGYIDRATRDSLNNAIGVEDLTQAKGSDDVQLPAIAKLPPLVAALLEAEDDAFFKAVDAAVAVTNDNDISREYGRISAAMMRAAARGASAAEAVAAGRAHASPEAAALIDEAATMATQTHNNAAAAHFGMACHLTSGIPVAVHNILLSQTYPEAIRRNIYAGGDTCGRAILIGAVMGALHGEGSETGIPKVWVGYLTEDLD
ncbi:ADP-ribosylglycohydrolase family protein [Gymnodinialimonas sp.]